MKQLFGFLFVALLVASISSFASASIIDNGDFEDTPPGTSWSTGGAQFENRVRSYDGWNMTGTYAALGTRGTNDDDWLSQSFYIAPGVNSVTVDFDFFIRYKDESNRRDDDIHVFGGYYDWTGPITGRHYYDWDVIGSWESPNTEGYMSYYGHASLTWTGFAGDIVDYDPNAILKFHLSEDRRYSTDTKFFIDNVSVTAPVPEPTTIMLFGIGLLGLAGVSRRKR